MKPMCSAFYSVRGAARVVVLALLVFSAASCSRDTPPATNAESNSASDLTVAVVKAAHEDLSRSVSLTAEFLPWQDVEIHAKVAGYVQQMNVDVGDHTKTGDVLAVLEIPEIQDELNQADAAVKTAQEEVKSAQAAYDETNLLAGRLADAAKESQGLIAQQDIDTADAKNRANDANLAAAKQRVVEAQANAAHLRDMVAYSKITAPFDGVVTRRYADVGALVQAGTVQAGTSSNSNSMPLVSFEQLNRLRLVFPVPESAVAFVHVGDPVEVNVSSLNKTFQGQVSRFAQKIDTATRTMMTEVDVDNSDFGYTPGMYATVRLILAEKKEALAVPIQSVSTGDKPTVMVVNQENKVEQRDVTIGLETPTEAEILSGVEEYDLVLVGSRSSVQVGQSVVAKVVDP
jgi:RND family efflux transporter MFP subunit